MTFDNHIFQIINEWPTSMIYNIVHHFFLHTPFKVLEILRIPQGPDAIIERNAPKHFIHVLLYNWHQFFQSVKLIVIMVCIYRCLNQLFQSFLFFYFLVIKKLSYIFKSSQTWLYFVKNIFKMQQKLFKHFLVVIKVISLALLLLIFRSVGNLRKQYITGHMRATLCTIQWKWWLRDYESDINLLCMLWTIRIAEKGH